MKLKQVTDINASELQIYHQFRENAFREDGSFVADSPKVVNLLISQGVNVCSILATQEYYDTHASLLQNLSDVLFYVASNVQMRDIVGHKIHHNVMMHGIRPNQVELENLGDHIVMLDELSKTENIGSIVRSAVALGVTSAA